MRTMENVVCIKFCQNKLILSFNFTYIRPTRKVKKDSMKLLERAQQVLIDKRPYNDFKILQFVHAS